jgi:hypothetical protein
MKNWSVGGALVIAALSIAACGDQMTTQPKRAGSGTSIAQRDDASANAGEEPCSPAAMPLRATL